MSLIPPTDPLTLWGEPHSLFTGKVRSYLIKKGLAYRELGGAHPRFNEVIVPRIGNLVVPIVEMANGELLQDSGDIIEHLESLHPEPSMKPDTPILRTIATLIDAWGSEGLLPPAMHYRWSYRSQQENFLRNEFGRILVCGPNREERLQAGAQLMDYFNGFLPALGVNSETINNLEARYEEFLDVLDRHLQHYPYILGGRPSIADFGFMAPLFAHLARDPVPASLMKNIAPNVYRWTERMNQPGNLDGEFYDCPNEFFPNDEVPPSLRAVLEIIFRDWTPELLANAEHYNTWLANNPDMPSGQLVSENEERKIHPTLGEIEYRQGDCQIRRASAPQTLWHFKKVLDQARRLTPNDANQLKLLLSDLGGEEMMAITLNRPMRRENHLLVLA